jgi:glycosyltransferase involved in cell wall biosynthesis
MNTSKRVMRQTITAIIPALNEEDNIERCIKSLLWCDKIQVLWMGHDKTGEIAKKLGAEVIVKNTSEKDNFVAVQKNINWAIDHATTDWILRIDADEVVDTFLQSEIEHHLETLTDTVAFRIPRKQYFWNGFLKGGDWAYDRLVRLFKPTYARYEPIVHIHEQFKVEGNIGELNYALEHYSHPTLKVARAKFQKYTDVEVYDMKISKQNALFNMVFQPPYVFLRWMIWHHGYKDGIRGIVAGAYRGWYEYLKYSKYLRKS